MGLDGERAQPARTSFCGGCAAAAECQFGIVALWLHEARVARCRIWVRPSMAGGPGVAHGGWTAAIFDELMGRLPLMRGSMAVTKSMTVDYTRPVPVNRWLTGAAYATSTAGGTWQIDAELALESTGARLAKAHGVWVERSPAHFERHRSWLREQDRLG